MPFFFFIFFLEGDGVGGVRVGFRRCGSGQLATRGWDQPVIARLNYNISYY